MVNGQYEGRDWPYLYGLDLRYVSDDQSPDSEYVEFQLSYTDEPYSHAYRTCTGRLMPHELKEVATQIEELLRLHGEW